jgi:hypothetical protein
VSDKDTFAQLAAHPEISLELLIGYVSENPELHSDWFARNLGVNAAERPDQWSVLLDGDMESLDLLEAQAALIGHVAERHRQVELLERLPAQTQARVAGLVFADRYRVISILSVDVHAARLLVRAAEDANLQGWLDKPIDADALEVLSGSDQVVAHRFLLSSRMTSREVKSEILSRMERRAAGDDAPVTLPVLPLAYLRDAVLLGRFDAGLKLRALRLLEVADPNRWAEVLRTIYRMVERNLVDTDEGRELVEYLAERVTWKQVRPPVEYLPILTRFDHLPTHLVVGVLRLSSWETTADWFARAVKRGDNGRITVLRELLAEQGRAFNKVSHSWAGPLTREEILSMRVAHLLPADAEMVDWLMRSCQGALSVGQLAGMPEVLDWLTGACADAGVSPERGYEVLLSLLPDWEGTPRELVDTVAAVA